MVLSTVCRRRRRRRAFVSSGGKAELGAKKAQLVGARFAIFAKATRFSGNKGCVCSRRISEVRTLPSSFFLLLMVCCLPWHTAALLIAREDAKFLSPTFFLLFLVRRHMWETKSITQTRERRGRKKNFGERPGGGKVLSHRKGWKKAPSKDLHFPVRTEEKLFHIYLSRTFLCTSLVPVRFFS